LFITSFSSIDSAKVTYNFNKTFGNSTSFAYIGESVGGSGACSSTIGFIYPNNSLSNICKSGASVWNKFIDRSNNSFINFSDGNVIDLALEQPGNENINFLYTNFSLNSLSNYSITSLNYTYNFSVSGLSNHTVYFWNYTSRNWTYIVNYSSAGLSLYGSNITNKTSDFINNSLFTALIYSYRTTGTGTYDVFHDFVQLEIAYTSFPNVTLNNPSNLFVSSTNNVTFNCSASDSIGLKNVTLYVWNSTGFLNQTNSTTINGTLNSTLLSLNFSNDGSYIWNCLVFNTENNSNWSYQNRTFSIATQVPAINLVYPTNNQYFKNGFNLSFNYTASDSHGLSTCQLFSNWSGSWSLNYTWLNPTNNQMNWTFVNISTNNANYKWGITCNDTLSINASSTNYTFTLDNIYPNLSISSISTTDGSQTITFNFSVNDTNLGTCKYSIYNSTNGVDGIYNNISVPCNSANSPTVSAFGNYTLIIYSIDLAGNENSTNQTFLTNPSTPIFSVGGGGGGASTISVVALQLVNGTIHSDLERAIMYARIREHCLNKTDVCGYTLNEYKLIQNILINYSINISSKEANDYLYYYNNDFLESVQLYQIDIDSYRLFTGVLQFYSKFAVNPSTLDPPFTILFFSKNFKFIVKSNRILDKISITGELGLRLEQVSDTEVNVLLNITNTDFSTKIFKGTANYIDVEGNSVYQEISIRVINLQDIRTWGFIGLTTMGGLVFIFRKKIFKR